MSVIKQADFTPNQNAVVEYEENLRARFKSLQARHAELTEQAKPFREKYDETAKKIHELEAVQKQCASNFKPIEGELFVVTNEMGAIARALKGKTA